ncbi:Uncharacterised protein [Mycobacteroides abscessus subsp. abscessus]|nr:Uncharacterised protein [Mycobacteroides abscessus subsp. abscessus]SKU57724.1 Uncharacterised protein [Mycobacteroides abscessus subsp. abscessus]
MSLGLQMASKWIYDRRDGIASNDPTAQWVVFQVVSNWLRYGKYGPLSEFSKTTGHRIDSGKLAVDDVARFFTDEYKMMLGIPLRALPMTSCTPGDFEADDANAGWPTSWSTQSGGMGLGFWGVTND